MKSKRAGHRKTDRKKERQGQAEGRKVKERWTARKRHEGDGSRRGEGKRWDRGTGKGAQTGGYRTRD